VRVADVIQRQRLVASVTELALNLKRFLVQRERVVEASAIGVIARQIQQRVAESALVADLAAQLKRLVVIFQRFIRPAQHVLYLRDFGERVRDAALLTETALEVERLLVIPQRIAGLVQALVRDADRVQTVALGRVVLQLNRESERLGQEFERAL